jgi:hypothetical protein
MPPWSTNQDRNLNKYKRAERIREWKSAARVAFIGYMNYHHPGHSRLLNPAIVQVTIPFTVDRIRDPHNYCGTVLKAVIDGLVKGGAWPDDSPEWVGHREPILRKGGEVWVQLRSRQ